MQNSFESNIDDLALPTLNINIPIFLNPQTKFWKTLLLRFSIASKSMGLSCWWVGQRDKINILITITQNQHIKYLGNKVQFFVYHDFFF